MRNIIKWIPIGLIKVYRLVISPLMPASCRFTPTCSAYAVEAIEKHGVLRGLMLTARRIGKCHPWGGCGHDPVPDLKNNTQHS